MKRIYVLEVDEENVLERLKKCFDISEVYSYQTELSQFEIDNLCVNKDLRDVQINKVSLNLIKTEYDIFELLYENRGHVLSYATIYECIWKEPALESARKIIQWHIHKMKEKIISVSSVPPFDIHVFDGVGYALLIDGMKTK